MRLSRQNARRRHDKLLRRYLTATRDRAEAQLAGSSGPRIEWLSVRERALAVAVRSLRRHVGLPETFDPELESARLGVDGKRPGRLPQERVHPPSPERDWRRRIKLVPSWAKTGRRNGEHPAHAGRAALAITVTDLLEFIEAHELDPDAEIVIRRLSGSHGNVERDLVNVAFVSLTDDGRVQLDIH